MYPSTTSKSSAGDSSSESSVGPSQKRCRSLAAIVTSSIHASKALVLSHLDLLPPQARSLIAGEERASLLDQVASLERSNERLRGTLMKESVIADTI
nr:hypothetical protein [Tanacetum cinerariifolium]